MSLIPSSEALLESYPVKTGIILAVLIGLTAIKILTHKRLEFFREAGSGFDTNAYFFAVNIIATIEHSIQVIIAAFFAYWIRKPISSWYNYYIQFFLLSWICVSWSLFFPMVLPPDSVVLVTGFFFAFCGLLFSGAFPPILYKSMYALSQQGQLFAQRGTFGAHPFFA